MGVESIASQALGARERERPPLDVGVAYREHGPFVARSLRRLGVPEADLEDLVQEVFLVAHRRSERFDPDARLSSWLFGIALRVAKRHRRRPRLLRERSIELAPEPSHARTPEWALRQERARRELDRGLGSLAPERREVYRLFELEQRPLREIAERTGVPIGTVCSRLHAARRELGRALRRGRVGAGGGALALLVLLAIGLAEGTPERAAVVTPEPQAPVASPAAPPAASPAVPEGPDAAPPRDVEQPRRAEPAAPERAVKPRRPRAQRAPATPELAWLAEARAALADDPSRTLALIREHREPGAPVTPAVVELTIEALEALRARPASPSHKK